MYKHVNRNRQERAIHSPNCFPPCLRCMTNESCVYYIESNYCLAVSSLRSIMWSHLISESSILLVFIEHVPYLGLRINELSEESNAFHLNGEPDHADGLATLPMAYLM